MKRNGMPSDDLLGLATVIATLLVSGWVVYCLSWLTFPQDRALVELSLSGQYCVRPYKHTQFLFLSQEIFNPYRSQIDCYKTKDEAVKAAQYKDDRYKELFVVHK
jgi:hypothetical protein